MGKAASLPGKNPSAGGIPRIFSGKKKSREASSLASRPDDCSDHSNGCETGRTALLRAHHHAHAAHAHPSHHHLAADVSHRRFAPFKGWGNYIPFAQFCQSSFGKIIQINEYAPGRGRILVHFALIPKSEFSLTGPSPDIRRCGPPCRAAQRLRRKWRCRTRPPET